MQGTQAGSGRAPAGSWLLAALGLVAACSLAGRWDARWQAAAGLTALAATALFAWRLDPSASSSKASSSPQASASPQASSSSPQTSPGEAWSLPGGARWRRSSVLALATVSIAAVWIGRQPPWTPWAGGLVWTGALLLAGLPRPRARLAGEPIAVGLAVGAGVGWLGAHAWSQTVASSVLLAALVVPVGRLLVVRVAEQTGTWPAAAFALAATVPLAAGRWGIAAVLVEAIGALVLLDEVEDAAARDAWALAGVGAGLGAGVALLT